MATAFLGLWRRRDTVRVVEGRYSQALDPGVK